MKEELIIPLVGGVVVAVIAGVISLVLAILAKDQKTSEFRQYWIDALREDAAHLAGMWFATSSAALWHRQNGSEEEYIKDRHADFADMFVRARRIILRLNVDEHVRLIGLLRGLEELGRASLKERENAMDDICAEVQGVLKAEWERVKVGELSFRILKICSMVCLLLGVVGGFWLYFGF